MHNSSVQWLPEWFTNSALNELISYRCWSASHRMCKIGLLIITEQKNIQTVFMFFIKCIKATYIIAEQSQKKALMCLVSWFSISKVSPKGPVYKYAIYNEGPQ